MDALSQLVTVNYLGMTEADEPVVFCANDDISFAILGVADPATNNSFTMVGNVTEQENGWLTITDETNNLSLTFEVISNEDGTITLDMGDTGKCTIAACSQQEALDTLQIIATYTNPVA